MSIYPSSKVLPYVYQCIHKTTGKIYIGSRANKKQKLPSHLDFPKYKTSSKVVSPIFNEFDWHIVAEFFDPKDAYNFEQELIHEQWQVSKEMSLNKFHQYKKKSWNLIGINRNHSEETNIKIGDANRGKLRSEEQKKNIRNSLIGRHHSEEAKKNMEIAMKAARRVEHSFLTPDGFVIENTTMSELCSQFNLNYNSISNYFRNNKSYKGFIKL